MGLLSSIGGAIAKGLDFVSAVALNPVKAVIHPVAATNEITKLRTEGTQADRNAYIKGVAVTTAINTAATLVPVSKVASIAKSAVSTTKGALITAAATPIVASAVVTNPSLIYEAPQKIVNFQTNVGKAIGNPTLENAKNIVKENPIISGVVAAGTAVAVGAGVTGLVSNYLNREATNKNTEAILASNNQNNNLPTGTTTYSNGVPATIPTNTETPKLPATIEVNKSTKRRKYKKQDIKPQNIIQKTNILIQNKNNSTKFETKKYLNAVAH